MTQHLRRAKSGDPLEIPANTFNSFIDAAEDFQAKSQSGGGPITPSPLPPGQVYILNTTGLVQGRFAILALDGVASSQTLGLLNNLMVFKTKRPAIDGGDNGRFVIVDEVLTNNTDILFRATLWGITPVRLVLIDNNHQFADLSTNFQQVTTRLNSSDAGTAQILWRSGVATAEMDAIVRLSASSQLSGGGVTFPINLTKTAGVDGAHNSIATWTYTVTSAIEGVVLGTNVNPLGFPHKVRREIGKIRFASFGYAYFNNSDNLVIGWINEVYRHTTCDL